MSEADPGSRPVPRPAHDPLLLPDGTRLTRDVIRRASLSLPPTCRFGDPPWACQSVRLYPLLDRNGAEVAELWISWARGAPRLGRTPFLSPFERKLRYDDCGDLCVAAEDHDWRTIDKFDPAVLPWYCRTCNCNYAESSWQIFPRWTKEGRVKGYGGVCPEGHERVLASL